MITATDVKRLLGRLARQRHSIYTPQGPPDAALAKVLVRGRVVGNRIVLVLNTRMLPAAQRKELVHALGLEGVRWLCEARVDMRGYNVGSAQPWYRATAKSLPRARKLLATIGRHLD